MTSKLLKLVIATLALLFIAAAAPRSADAASVEMFVKIDGIDGESTDKDHPRWIPAFAVHTGLANGGSNAGTGSGAGKVHFSDLVFAHNVDKASPLLALHAAQGLFIKTVVIEFRKAGGDQRVFYRITLHDVLVASVALNASGENVGEQVTLGFSKLEWEYRGQNGAGQPESIKGGWDVKANVKL